MLVALELKEREFMQNNIINYLVGFVSMHTAVKFFSINYIIGGKQIDDTM
jgi:hypothetical protein